MFIVVVKGYGILKKGAIVFGFDVDLVLVDLNNYCFVLREELMIKCRWSFFEGWSLIGWFVVIIVGGEVVFNCGEFNFEVWGWVLIFLEIV